MFDKVRQVKYYEDLLSRYGDNYLSLDWKTPESQDIRYSVFWDLINMFGQEQFSVLDVGCGFGDIFGYLNKLKLDFTYHGLDIAPKIIDHAHKKYPNAQFEVKDILEDHVRGKYDFVFLSGALNICFGTREEHLEFIRSMLIRMFELCKIAVGVNFLSSQAIYCLKDEDLLQKQYFYSKPEEIVSFAKGLTNRFILRHDYHPGDFTVYLIK